MRINQIIFLIVNLILLCNCDRPKVRKFASTSVDLFIEKIKPKFKSQKLAQIFENCFPNTLDTTVEFDDDGEDTFIITGDIKAMWLRDSSFQIFPFLKFANSDIKLKKMMLNLIKRHTKSILIDPYANAFNKNETDSPWLKDKTYKLENGKKIPAMNKKLWERKYELDSPISTLFFAFNFFNETGDGSFIENPTWQEALEKIIKLVKDEMKGTEEEDKNGDPEYFFQRSTLEAFDSLHQGRGNPVNSCGLVKTMFRNSDDAVTFAYNIPENAFLVSTFRKVSSMLKKYSKQIKPYQNKNSHMFKHTGNMKLKLNFFIKELNNISKSVNASIYSNGIFYDPKTGEKYFAYEVDCYGNHYFIDDPGYPSLISLPFFGFIDSRDPLYISTRNRIISYTNPYYFKGVLGEGLGSAHSARHYIWPLFTIMRALTSNNDEEITNSLNLLVKSAELTGFMHESFHIDNAEKFTRPWFAWANSFFGYLINHLIETKPHLILKNYSN